MAKKIDGYCQKHDNQDYLDRGNTVFVNRTPCTGKDPRCTVVVHKGKSERVFTESEVQSVIDAIAGLAQGYWESSGPGGPDMLSVDEIETECARIGIVPDPA